MQFAEKSNISKRQFVRRATICAGRDGAKYTKAPRNGRGTWVILPNLQAQNAAV